MWLWLRKKLPKSFQLWSKLIAYVGGLHLLALFALFFVYKGDYHSFSFDLNHHIDLGAAVVFLPLQKKAQESNEIGGCTQKQTMTQEIQPIEKKELKITSVKPEKATTLTTIKTPKKKIKSSKKNKKATTQKKNKQSEPAQKDPKPIKEIPQPIETKPIDQMPLSTINTDAVQTYTGFENVQYLGQLDLEALQVQEAVASEIHKHWSPPPGISKKAVCELDILVSWEGMVNFTLKKSSGIAIYDISARSAMLKVSFPKQLWGKQFLIAFKQ